MKTGIVVGCFVAAGLAAIGLFSQGCGGSDDSASTPPNSGSSSTNPPSATPPSTPPAEITFVSQTVIIGSPGIVGTTAGIAPTNGTVTATATWSGGGMLEAQLLSNGALVATVNSESPLAMTANTAAGKSWDLVLGNTIPPMAPAGPVSVIISVMPP